MVIKKSVTKTIKKKPAASQIKNKAAPVKKIASASVPKTVAKVAASPKPKTVKTAGVKSESNVNTVCGAEECKMSEMVLPKAVAWKKVQTAEGWKRGLKKGKAK
jgi:prolyl-tRNA synthetase